MQQAQKPAPSASSKSCIIAYILWLFFGWCGAHHFYLGRDRHGFVWLFTLGGCFGMGWFSDLWRLPEYVRSANGRFRPATDYPSFSIKRFIGEVIFGYLIGFLSVAIFPKEVFESLPVVSLIGTIFVAIGVHTVANIGHEAVPFHICLIGSSLSVVFFFFGMATQGHLSYAILFSSVAACYKARWRRTEPRKRSCCARFGVVSAASVGVSVMMITAIYFNGSITTKHGEKVMIRDAINNILTSPAWGEFRNTTSTLFQYLWHEGFERFFKELAIALDPEGEENAYRVLNVTSAMTQKEISARYKDLVKQYHPDKVKPDEEFDEQQIQERFIRIQQAYEKLSVLHERRSKNSMKSEL